MRSIQVSARQQESDRPQAPLVLRDDEHVGGRPCFVQIHGHPAALAEEVRRTRRSPQYGHPAHGKRAQGYGPCRLCRAAAIGAEMAAVHLSAVLGETGNLPAPGPVFIHAEPCERLVSTLPPDFRALPLVIEGFRARGGLAVQTRVAAVRSGDRTRFRRNWRGVYIRNGEAGCFMARIDRDGIAAQYSQTGSAAATHVSLEQLERVRPPLRRKPGMHQACTAARSPAPPGLAPYQSHPNW